MKKTKIYKCPHCGELERVKSEGLPPVTGKQCKHCDRLYCFSCSELVAAHKDFINFFAQHMTNMMASEAIRAGYSIRAAVIEYITAQLTKAMEDKMEYTPTSDIDFFIAKNKHLTSEEEFTKTSALRDKMAIISDYTKTPDCVTLKVSQIQNLYYEKTRRFRVGFYVSILSPITRPQYCIFYLKGKKGA